MTRAPDDANGDDVNEITTPLQERGERTWDDRVMSLLQRVADHFEDTDAPLGKEAKELLIRRLEAAAAEAGIDP